MASRSTIAPETRKLAAYKHSCLQQRGEPVLLDPQTIEKDCLTASKSPKTNQLKGLIGGEYKQRQVTRKDKSDVLESIRLTAVKTLEAQNYKKQHNLKLSDYLRLTSMSKRSASSSQNKSLDGARKTGIKTERDEGASQGRQLNKKSPINNQQGIQLVRNETAQEMRAAEKDLLKLLDEMEKSEFITDDEESLVFMCNVLNIFEEKIGISVAIAQELLEEQKKAKQIAGFRQFKNELSGPKTRGRLQRLPTSNFSNSSRALHS